MVAAMEANSVYQSPTIDELRTLFISGLPDDVKPREIFNLFREFPGFESYFLPRSTFASRDKPFAFANFVDQQLATVALQALNGMVFDLEKGSTLLIDLVKYNFPPERPKGDHKIQDSGKRQKGLLFAYGVCSIHVPGMDNSASDMIISSSSDQVVVKDGAKKKKSKRVPGPKLIVNDLGKTCSIQELKEVFSSYHGFKKLNMGRVSGRLTAFVEYEDTECSTEARRCLQGLVLPSSEPDKGISITFDWSKEQLKQRKLKKQNKKKRNRINKEKLGFEIPDGNALQEKLVL